jgi:hypothetical protein
MVERKDSRAGWKFWPFKTNGTAIGAVKPILVRTSFQPIRLAAGSAEPRRPKWAMRTVYQRAIDEDIPPEMLDLLGKLG